MKSPQSTAMIRITLGYLTTFFEKVDRLSQIPLEPTTVRDVRDQLVDAHDAIYAIHVGGSLYAATLRASVNLAMPLMDAIRAAAGVPIQLDKAISIEEIGAIRSALSQYRVAVSAELNSADMYLVTQKGSHNPILLLTAGETLFPDSLSSKCPEAIKDAQEAGKCLAYEVPTACGFHTFRVVEVVLKRYWDQISTDEKRPIPETIGKFAAEMEQKNIGDTKVIESLKQLAKLHRNPLVHPEVILTVDEALDILGIARSIVSAMLRVLPDIPPTTSASSPS